MKRLVSVLLVIIFLPAILLAGITILACEALNQTAERWQKRFTL
jgi:nitrogen fixation/metabolism regulation signal transduction histidine kinase